MEVAKNTFSVWIRPLGSQCKVRVQGIKNARWLLTRLSQSFVFKSSEAIADNVGTASAIFHVPYSSQISRSKFERLLGAIPEVELMLDPA